ncbi:unnamed protein product [Adineta steineri]|uniref:DUF4440 domain-containing protein n=1 Tax=Adineta steineri TaxID=433720 RepID=A0A818V981_9BILA|nr:unnamed protein product [Adineta steineri]CAF3705547.1 unnamed protein product [Adineta steineri]
MTSSLSSSELCAALPSTYETDKALLRSHPKPIEMTDDQAKAIVEAGNRIYLRQQYSRKFDEQFDECFTEDFRIYPETQEEPWIGRKKMREVAQSEYGDGTHYMTSIKVLEVHRAGDYLMEWSSYEENDSSRGYFAVLWKFDNGQWRRMRDICN